MTSRIFFVALAALVMVGCGGQSNKASEPTAEGDGADKVAVEPRVIPIPDLPYYVSNEQQAIEFMCDHFWDKFDFADTTYIDTLQSIETAFVQYAKNIGYVPMDMARRSVTAMMTKAQKSKAMFDHFAGLCEKYLYDPNSPVKNEEAYIGALEVMTTTSLYDEWERVRPQSQLDLALKNRIGTKANDFRYTTKEGTVGTLYGIRAKYTLLFINNPGCPACKDTREQISASPMLTQLIDEGVIRVLAVYPDEDLKEWYDYQPNMPSNWINSYDKELAMRDKELYDLRAIPTLYLLDQNKSVLLKDCMSIPLIEQVIYYRDYNNQQ